MGCDIHLYREKFVDGKWLTADDGWTDEPSEDDDGNVIGTHKYLAFQKRAYTGRNYDLFGLLAAGVRRKFDFSFAPRGMPLQPSEEVQSECESWDSDGHNHSYLYLHELRELAAYLKTATLPIKGQKQRDELKALRESIATGAPDWNLLYPYCGWTSSDDYEDFEIDVPASFICGDGIDALLASFEGCDGATHRIVFWFDN